MRRVRVMLVAWYKFWKPFIFFWGSFEAFCLIIRNFIQIVMFICLYMSANHALNARTRNTSMGKHETKMIFNGLQNGYLRLERLENEAARASLTGPWSCRKWRTGNK